MDLEGISTQGYKFTNWSRTYECTPEAYFVPETLDELREIIFLAKSDRKRIRVVGCGNSPSDICCSDDYMISLECFNRVLHVDKHSGVIRAQAGIKLSDLNVLLEKNDLAMPVLGSISDSTLAGVISVGTHGTGFNTGIIADYVTEIRLIVPSGDIVVCSRNSQQEVFLSVLCGLGALGVIVEVSVQCEPKFYLHQLTYPSTLDSVLERLDENVESCDHFRFLWFPHTDYVSVSITNRVNGKFLNLSDLNPGGRRLSESSDESDDRFEHLSLSNSYGAIPYRLSSDRGLLQRAVDWLVTYGVGYHLLQLAYWASTFLPSLVPSINRFAFWFLYSTNHVQLDISHKIFNFECLFKQYVNEWAIPRNRTEAVLRELKQEIEASHTFYAHFPVEVRFCRSSEIYLSPTYGRDTTYINIICYRPYGKFVPHWQYWDLYERIVKKAGGRPHWAKAHRETSQSFVKMYPYFRAWTQVRRRLDPHQLFSNSYIDRIFCSPLSKQLFPSPDSPDHL